MVKTVILDGKTIKSERDFHDVLNNALDFGPYYGNNTNALWDMLSTDVERPCEVIWTDFALSEDAIGEGIKHLLSVFDKAATYDLNKPENKRFTYRIER